MDPDAAISYFYELQPHGSINNSHLFAIGNISDIFFCAWILEGDKGCAYKAARMSQRGGLSVVTSVSEHARAHGLNSRNIHTGAPTRYYRGIIQTYLYPSPMTADMTCDRLRYRLHDMPRSLAPSSTAVTILYTTLPTKPLYTHVFLLVLPSLMENMQPAQCATRLHLCVFYNRNVQIKPIMVNLLS